MTAAVQFSSNFAEINRLRGELDAIGRERLSRSAECDRLALLRRSEAAYRDSKAIRIDEYVTVAATRVTAVLNDMGRYAEALRWSEDKMANAGRMGGHRLAVPLAQEHIRALVGLARQSDGRAREYWEAVERQSSATIAKIEDARSRVSVLALANAYMRFSIDVYAMAVEARLALGDIEGALERVELVKCRSIHRLRQQRPKDDEHEAVVRSFRDVSRELETATTAEEREQLAAKRRALWDLLSIDRFAEPVDTFLGFDVDVVRSLLPERTAVVSWFWVDSERLFVAAIDRDKVVGEVRNVGAAMRTRMEQKADLILRFRDKDAKYVMRLPRAWTGELFPPRIRAVLEGKRRLILSPHRALHALPLHALRWQGHTPLLRHFAVCYAPNLTVLMQRQPPSRARRVALFVGVPHRDPEVEAGSRLDGASRELKLVAEAYEPAHLSGLLSPDSSRARVLEALQASQARPYTVLHFACHGLNVDSDNPMESKLSLYDTDVDGLEIAQWRLDAEVVVLSACSSGQRPVYGRGLRELPGDELFGLQAAFFAAGARQILAALWIADDAAATQICGDFHTYWQQHPADIALQKAVHDYLDFWVQGKVAAEGTPYLWAPYFLTVAGMPGGDRGQSDD